MAIKFTNNAKTGLAANILSTDTIISVVDVSVFPALSAGDKVYLTLSDQANQITEIVLCTAISGANLTVTRGYDNTTARDWTTADQISCRLTAGLLDELLTLDNLGLSDTDSPSFEIVNADLSGAALFTAKVDEVGGVVAGDAVYIKGVAGNDATVAKASSTVPAKMPAFGLAKASTADEGYLDVVTFGTLKGIQTDGLDRSETWSVGDTLYVNGLGTVTNVKPSGESAALQNIGMVQRVHASNGSIKVGGAGRTAATPNLNDGNVFIGNAQNQSESRALTIDDVSGVSSSQILNEGTALTISGNEITLVKGDATTDVVTIDPPSVTVANHVGDGVTTTFTTNTIPNATESVFVILGGVVQTPVTDYSVVGGDVVFTTAPQTPEAILFLSLGLSGASGLQGVMTGHIIPDTDVAWDIGTVDKKIRDIFVSTGSIWMGEETKLSVSDTGELTTVTRKTGVMPKVFVDAGYTEADLPVGVTNANATLSDWITFGQAVFSNPSFGMLDLFPTDAAEDFEPSVSISDAIQASGGTMTGPLELAADPVASLEAATKQYVDTSINGFASDIDGLTDVDTSTVAPVTGQALVWDDTSSAWVPGSVAASGGGSGTSVSYPFTLSNTAAVGDPLLLNNDGTVSSIEVSQTVGAPSGSEGTPTVFSSANTSLAMSISGSLSTVGEFAVVYTDGGQSYYGNVALMTRSGVGLSLVSEYNFNPGSTWTPSIDFCTGADKAVVSFRDGGHSNYPKIMLLTRSGSSWTKGAEALAYSNPTYSTIVKTDPNNTNECVLTFKDNWGFRGIQPWSISGTSLITSSYYSNWSDRMTSSGNNYDGDIEWLGDSRKFIVGWDEGTTGKLRIGTVSGTGSSLAISYGSSHTFSPSYGAVFKQNGIKRISATKFVIVYKEQNAPYPIKTLVGTVSGTNITTGTPVTLVTDNATGWSVIPDPANADKVMYVYKGNTAGKVQARTATISGTTITLNADEHDVVTDNAAIVSAIADPDESGKIVTAYSNSTTYGTAVVGTTGEIVTVTNYDSAKIIGIAEEAGLAAESIAVTLEGVDSNRTGLTVNSDYYVQDDGSVSTESTSPAKLLGKSVATDALLLKI